MKNLTYPGLPRVLIVDDEADVRDGLRTILQHEGLVVETADSAAQGVARAGERPFDVVFCDLNLPDAEGLAVVGRLRRGEAAADVVVLAGYGASPMAVDAMRQGAAEVIERPFAADRVLAVVRRVLEARQLKNERAWLQDRVRALTSTELVGLSPAIRAVQARIEQIAQTPDAAVLVVGEAGVGKELVARCIHERSARRHGPFVVVNCASLTAALLEAELFGYEAGAFAGGARAGKHGVFALAAGGTLLLDEIAEMDPSLQVKLLRVLQERTFRRVGGVQELPADVRVIATTRRDLRQLVQKGGFREDLFYRLDVMAVQVPPLRERTADIPLLSHWFLDQIGRQMGKALAGFSEEAMETLCEPTWPGNVRELRLAIEHACIVCPGGMIEEAHLPKFTGGLPDGSDAIDRSALVLTGPDLSLRTLESVLVAKVLEDTQWNISRAAAVLGINRTTLYNKIRLYQLGKRPARPKVDA